MSKKEPLVAHHEKLRDIRDCGKGFSGLADHFRKMAKAHATKPGPSESLRRRERALQGHGRAPRRPQRSAQQHGEQCDKAIRDRMSRPSCPTA